MVLLNPALLAGLAVVVLPIILHWLLRAKPKPLQFPALRLLQMRRKQNTSRMRLRHLWLLLLRILVLGLLVLALARPSVPAADYSLNGADWLRVLGLAAFIGAVFWGAEWLWKRRKLPPHLLQNRRSQLRGGMGVLGIILFVLLLVLPYQKRIAASITQPTITAAQTLPVAAVMLFDNSLSMQYGFESRTRLDAAREIALQHVRNLPSQSRVAVGEITSEAPLRFQMDRSGAQDRIESLQLQPFTRPMEDRLAAAFELHREDAERQAKPAGDGGAVPESVLREIYLFTDLAASAWRRDTSVRLQELLQKMPSVSIYLIDVGITSPQNVAVSGLALSSESLAAGNVLSLRVTISATGTEPVTRSAELYVMNEAGKPIKKGQSSSLTIEPGGSAQAEFSLRDLAGPMAQGEVRLTTGDPLAFDDVRSFTVQIHPPRELLVVGDSRTDAEYVMNALAPPELVQLGRAPYRCRYASPSRLATEPLKRYAAVFLIDVPDPGAAGWKALTKYVQEGGGLGLAVGPKVRNLAYLTPDALALLPAKLIKMTSYQPREFIDLDKLTHPLFQKFTEFKDGVMLITESPIAQFWRVEPFPESRVIHTYTYPHRKDPAWLERTVGKGRVVMFTSALRPGNWNNLPSDGQAGFVAMNWFWAEYLSQVMLLKFNYLAGELVSVPLPPAPEDAAAGYLLRKPEKQQLPGEIPPGARSISPSPRDLDQLGNYRVLGASQDSKFDSGFSINADPAESRLERIGTEDLDRILGKDRYSISRDIENLKRRVLQGRVGREAFPLIAIVLLAVFVGEHLVANFFYDAPREEGEQASPKAT